MIDRQAVGKYGKLEVLRENGRSKRGHIMVLCLCECGGEIVTTWSNVRTGKTKSCGCLKHQNPHNFKGGESKTRLYRVWEDMHARCKKETNKSYCNYGARGIKVCAEWSDYFSFKRWATDNGYASSLTIDRIDVNGMYAPSNCRWILKAEQQNNKRNNRYIKYDGITMCLTQWAKDIGINPRTLNGRLAKGWSVEQAFETPTKTQYRHCGSRRPTDAERQAAGWRD